MVKLIFCRVRNSSGFESEPCSSLKDWLFIPKQLTKGDWRLMRTSPYILLWCIHMDDRPVCSHVVHSSGQSIRTDPCDASLVKDDCKSVACPSWLLSGTIEWLSSMWANHESISKFNHHGATATNVQPIRPPMGYGMLEATGCYLTISYKKGMT